MSTSRFSPSNLNLTGPVFNKALVDAALNNSLSKASFAFSKAKRFSQLSVDKQGFGITMLKTSERKNEQLISRNAATTRFLGSTEMTKKLHNKSGSVENVGPYDQAFADDDDLEVLKKTKTNDKILSNVSSIERMNAGGHNSRNTMITDLRHIGHSSSSMAGSAMKIRQQLSVRNIQ